MANTRTSHVGKAAIALFVSIVASSINAEAQDARVIPQPEQSQSTSPLHQPSVHPSATDIPKTALNADDTELLRQQVQIIQDFQSDILATVYWALGVVFGITVILVTYGWYANYKVYQRDKAAITEEIRSIARNDIAAFSQDQRNLVFEERTRTDEARDSLRTELIARMDQSIADMKAALGTQIRAAVEESIQNSLSLFRTAERNSTFISLRLTALQMERASDRGSHDMRITYALRLIREAIDADIAYYIQRGMEELSGAIDKKGKFTKGEIEDAPKILARVPENLHKLRDEIIAKLATAAVMST